MSLVERDELMQRLNSALNMVCDEVDHVQKRAEQTENPHMKRVLSISENTQNAADRLKSYLEESLASTNDSQVKKKIKLAIKQVDLSIKKKSNNNV